jgi:hypothetical protein
MVSKLENINSGAILDDHFACESGHAASRIRTEVGEFWFAGESLHSDVPFPRFEQGLQRKYRMLISCPLHSISASAISEYIT